MSGKPRSLVRVLARALGLSLLVLLSGRSHAHADKRFAIESFEPSPFVEGSVFNVYGAHTLRPRAYTLSVLGSYGRKPLTLENEQRGNTLAELIGSVGTLNLMAGVGIWKRLDIGVVLPLHRISRGSKFDPATPPLLELVAMESTKIAVGDLRLVPRVSLLGGEHGFGLALLAPVWLPTGKDEHYAGEPVRVEPRVSADWKSERGALVAMNVGYLVRSRADILGSRVDDMLRVGVGGELPLGFGLSGLAEIDTQLNVLGSGTLKSNAPTEGFLGLRLRKAGFIAQLGGGPGLVRGIGAPRYRLFASLSFSHVPPPDSDEDGIADDVDRCPKEPEDKDEFQDADGCPDPDNDGDLVPDTKDRCANEPEDRDGFQDDDGCRELDNDADAVADPQDRCPDVAEDRDGFDDADGCPELDNDADAIPDQEDRCSNQPGVAADGGCPPPPVVETPKVTPAQIELPQPVMFETNRAVIEPESAALIAELAEVIVAHPELELIRVEGHSDNTGSLGRNRTLSRERAEAVRAALIERGVEPARLRAEGHGPDQPLAANETEEGRAQNRRVSLQIERRADESLPPAP